MDYMQKNFTRFVPAKVEQIDSRTYKKPRIKGWLNVTEEQSAELARHPEYKDGHYMFLTGKANNIMVIDIDRKDPSRPDHADKIDGLKKWDELFPDLDYTNSFIVMTPSGGRHLYCEYDETITSREIAKDVLINILSDGCAVTYGPLYEILQLPEVTPPVYPEVKMYITNQLNNCTVYNSNIGNNVNIASVNKINSVLSKDVGSNWNIEEAEGAFKITPSTNRCCVDTNHFHSEDKHSCIYVRRISVIAQCFSHGKRTIIGHESRALREIFFEFSGSKGVVANIFEDILAKAESEDLFRCDGAVFKRNGNREPEFVNSYDKFLTDCLEDNTDIMEVPRRFNDLMLSMEKLNSSRFPFVTREKKYIGFSNGFLDIISGELVDDISNNLVPRHYVDQPFQVDDLHTPLFDRVMMHQLEDDEVYTYMLAFIGRLFYDVGEYDKLDVIPFVVGSTGTGKSTLMHIISSMFAPDSVGSLNSTHEVIFGLQSLYDKELIIAPEVDDKMADQLSSSVFKMMVSGDKIGIPFKHMKSRHINWKAPMFMCGNQHLNYKDDQGSVSRRLAIFKFDKYVPNSDSSLRDNIIRTELSKILVKSLMAYRQLLEYAGTMQFWSVCPPYFKDNIDDLNQCTDYIYMFLTLAPGDNIYADKDVYFMKQKGAIMYLQDFKKRFLNYMRYRHPGVKYKWTSDYSSFHKLGYRVTCKNVYKDTSVKPSIANRCKRYVIEDLACIENDDY